MRTKPDLLLIYYRDINYFSALISFGELLSSHLWPPCLIPCEVVLYYDYALTLGDEIERFWNRDAFTWTSLFFFMNRYLVLLGNIPVMFQSFWAPRDLSDKILVSPGRIRFYHYHRSLRNQV